MQDGRYWKETEIAIDSAGHILNMDGNYSQMVVLDIDETSLSNVEMYREMDYTPTPAERANWPGNAPAIPATLDFYKVRNRVSFFCLQFDCLQRD